MRVKSNKKVVHVDASDGADRNLYFRMNLEKIRKYPYIIVSLTMPIIEHQAKINLH